MYNRPSNLNCFIAQYCYRDNDINRHFSSYLYETVNVLDSSDTINTSSFSYNAFT